MKYIPKYQVAGKLPTLNAYANYQAAVDNTRVVEPIIGGLLPNEEKPWGMVKKEITTQSPKPVTPKPNILHNIGTEALDALNTFGGSLVGNLVRTVGGENAAKAVEKYSYGMLPYTKDSQYESNGPGQWANRLNNIANSLSMVVGGEVAAGGIGYGVKKAAPYAIKYGTAAFNKAKQLNKALVNKTTRPKIPAKFNDVSEFQAFADTWSNVHLNQPAVDNALVNTFGKTHSLVGLEQAVYNGTLTNLESYNLILEALRNSSNNFSKWKTKQEVDKLIMNKSGYPKILLPNASFSEKFKSAILPNSMYKNTVLKPDGVLSRYIKPGIAEKELSQSINKMDVGKYVKKFNNNLMLLNDIINRNNISGVPYRVTELTEDGYLKFLSSLGESQFFVGITPGKFTGKVKNLTNYNYYNGIPGLSMTSNTRSIFPDEIPRRGTRTYQSLNEYLTLLDMGRVKSGFNTQTIYSKGLWDNLIKNKKAFGYLKNPGTTYGIMRTVAPLTAVGTAGAGILNED